jgi:hypothetical protein
VAFVRHTTFRAGVLEYMIHDRDLVGTPLPLNPTPNPTPNQPQPQTQTHNKTKPLT